MGEPAIHLFEFYDGDPEKNRELMDEGYLPWWTSEDLRHKNFRYVSVLTMQLDFLLWPELPVAVPPVGHNALGGQGLVEALPGPELQDDALPSVAVEGDPEATIQKMQQVRRAALAPSDPSSADRAVAAKAQRAERQARAEQREQAASDGESTPTGAHGTYGAYGAHGEPTQHDAPPHHVDVVG